MMFGLGGGHTRKMKGAFRCSDGVWLLLIIKLKKNNYNWINSLMGTRRAIIQVSIGFFRTVEALWIEGKTSSREEKQSS